MNAKVYDAAPLTDEKRKRDRGFFGSIHNTMNRSQSRHRGYHLKMVRRDGENRDDAPATLVDTASPLPPVPTAPIATTIPSVKPQTGLLPPGYDLGASLGHGGMGEVIAAYDRRIGRDVAFKRMLSARPNDDEVGRFLREARIQARLDHPAIVPVYELGFDDNERPFFTMKQLAGTTFVASLAQGAAQSRLLRVVVDVCRAIDLAHARGVIHRDLKPANIMLGEYGEVYVLDWGVAHVATERESFANRGDIAEVSMMVSGTSEMLGTPGYMAPEQIRVQAISPAADIYALGAILFEVLTREPLHPRDSLHAIATTLGDPEVAPSARRPELAIPPELDALCAACLAEDPTTRPTARQLADRLESYLDGDRDLERRCALARVLVQRARDALADTNGRATAMKLAGRALALDQDSLAAAEIVAELIVTPPQVLPAQLASDLDELERRAAMRRSRIAMWACLFPFLLIPVIPSLEIVSWPWLIGFYGAMLAYAILSWRAARHQGASFLIGVPANLVIVIVWSRVAGPFMLTPLLVCAAVAFYAWHRAVRTRIWLLLLWATIATMLPIVLEWVGVLSTTTTTDHGVIATHSTIYAIRGDVELIALTLANCCFVIGVVWLAGQIARASIDAQRKLHVQSWHLRQLVPTLEERHLAHGRTRP